MVKAVTKKKPAVSPSKKNTKGKAKKKIVAIEGKVITKPEGYVFGRPTLYKVEYGQMIIDWFDSKEMTREITRTYVTKQGNEVTTFDIVACELPTMIGFAHSIGVSRATLYNWCREYPDFLDSVTYAQEVCEEFIIQNSLQGRYNPKIAELLLHNYSSMKKNNEDVTPPGERPQGMTLVQNNFYGRDVVDRLTQALLSKEGK